MANYHNNLAAQGFYMHAQSTWIRHSKLCSSTLSISSAGRTIQNTPSLILLFSWTGASPRHVSTYTADYMKMFPNTPIILITTTLSDVVFRSALHKQLVLLPAVQYILSRHLDSNIHVHCFSEGGSHKAIQFAKTYLFASGNRLPISSLCLDSTPGEHRYHRLAQAFKLSLPPNVLLRAFGLIFAYIVVTLLWCFYTIFGVEKNITARIRRGLENQQLWDTWRVPRCYLYSEKDGLIKYQDGERHAIEAERKGVPVLMVRFSESEHCHHVREDAEKYWGAVRWTLRRSWGSQGEVVVEKEKEISAKALPLAPMVSTREIRVPEPVAQRGNWLQPAWTLPPLRF